jgi:GTP-binding protein
MIKTNDAIRNIAIIAHVDHGKTTLVDAMFRQSGLANAEKQDRIMDSGAIERERGITISAKNCAIEWKGVKINIIDTPGHADFGGEVERALSMVDGVVLLCDAAEGPLPQTRFVLQKALKLNLKPIVIINKIDRADARPKEVLDEVYDLLFELSDDEELLDSPVFFANGRDGICGKDIDNLSDNLFPLLDSIVESIPVPVYDDEEPFQMLVSDLSYSDFLGRLAIGKIINGSATINEQLVCIEKDDVVRTLRVTKLHSYSGPTYHEAKLVESGDIVVLAGVDNVSIGDTICTKENPKALPRLTVDEPTVAMQFSKNISPIAGTEGTQLTSGKIGAYLKKEALRNVSIKVEKNSDDSYTVKGRGEFQMAIIIEEMRRAGFELCVGRPRIIFHKDEDGKKTEPIEYVDIDCPEMYSGSVMDKLSRRKAKMMDMTYNGDRVKIRFEIPARGLIGYRDEFLTDTRGMGIMNSWIKGYEAFKGEFPSRSNGSLISDRNGSAIPYALFNFEDRGDLFIVPGDPVYEGMIVGLRNKEGDLLLNPTKTKKLSNMRASGKDEAVSCTPISPMNLEQSIQFIKDDELVEVTPVAIRMCKKILNAQARKMYESRGSIPDYIQQ